jgi:uncharacterized protein (DUF736 family)
MTDARINASLFKNTRKESENQPDFTGPGSVSIENLKAIYEAAVANQVSFDDRGNVVVRVAGWKKTSSSGNAYISLSLQLDRPKPATTAPAATVEITDDLF